MWVGCWPVIRVTGEGRRIGGDGWKGEAGDKETGEEIHKEEGAEAFPFRPTEHGGWTLAAHAKRLEVGIPATLHTKHNNQKNKNPRKNINPVSSAQDERATQSQTPMPLQRRK